MTCTRIFLGILSVAVLATPARAAQAAPNCEQWNTPSFFRTATVEDVTACLAAGADTTAGIRRVEGEFGFGDTTRSDGAYEDRYSHVGRAGQSLVVEVRYSDLDGDLIVEVESPSGKWFYVGGGRQTPLSLSLDETGEYRILVSSIGSDVSGPYTLHIGNGGRTPLYYAGRYNENPAVIEALLAAGADVAARDYQDITVLAWAAFGNPNPAVIEALLAAGAEVDARRDNGQTPLHDAAEQSNENPAVIEALLLAGAELEARDEDGVTPLYRAAQNGNPAAVSALLAAGAEVDPAEMINGRRLLHVAARVEDPALVEALLAAGAEVNARAENGETLLHEAAQYNENPTVIETLLAAGAGVNARSDNGNTPLHEAARINENQDPAVIEALLAAGADPNARRQNGATPLHRVAFNSNPAVIEALLAAGAEVDARDEDGNTPLHGAAEYNYRFVSGDYPHAGAAIEALLDAGADAAARNASGQTPWDLAQENEALRGADAYWRLNDARFNAPGPDTRSAPAGGRPTAAVPGGATVGAPAGGVGASAGQCEIPGYPSPPAGAANVGLSWCPASVGIQVRAFALQVAGAQCAIATGSSSMPEQINTRREEIQAACDGLAAMGVSNCQCPASVRP